MNQTTMFRLLVVASIVTAVLGAAIDSLVPGLLPEVFSEAYDAHEAAEEPTLLQALALMAFGLVLLIGTVISTIGLWMFKPWSRRLSLWLSVAGILSYPALGPFLYSGWAAMFTWASMVLGGAVLAMAYFAEVKDRFEPAPALAADGTK